MTFRTFDIDAGHVNPETDVTAPTRHARSRRRSLVLANRSSGARLTGFGF